MADTETDIARKAIGYAWDVEIDEKKNGKINFEIRERVNSNPIVLETRKRYNNWMRLQDQTIEMLSILIDRVYLHYEA